MAGTEIDTRETDAGWREGGVVGVVVHPRRSIDKALDGVRAWAADHGGSMRQVDTSGQGREVAEKIPPEDCDVIVAVGGDGTVLAAVHAAADAERQVMGVACGSLGALTSVTAADVPKALDRFAAQDYVARALPALRISRDGEPIGRAFNDLIVVRAGAGQVIVEVDVDGEPYARLAGDGLVLATPLGSSAYTIATGGPLLAPDADGMVLTALAAHGGSIPPFVLTSRSTVELRVDGGFFGARVERDGQQLEGDWDAPFEVQARVEPRAALLVDLDGETLVAGLRRRGVIADSPRLRAREERKRRSGDGSG